MCVCRCGCARAEPGKPSSSFWKVSPIPLLTRLILQLLLKEVDASWLGSLLEVGHLTAAVSQYQGHVSLSDLGWGRAQVTDS